MCQQLHLPHKQAQKQQQQQLQMEQLLTRDDAGIVLDAELSNDLGGGISHARHAVGRRRHQLQDAARGAVL